MSFETPSFSPKIEVEPNFTDFVPDEFRLNPIAYFEEKGVNIKSGEVTYGESGVINEDPNAVKDLPVWTNSAGQELLLVAKRVNTEKAQIKKNDDPFYEYKVMEIIQELGLSAPKPIVKVEQPGVHMIVMERVSGFRWVNNDIKFLKERGYSKEDLVRLEAEANEMMFSLSKRYEDSGIIRKWKLRDMIFDLDVESKTLKSLTPVDWERTKLDFDKITKARVKLDKVQV